MGNNSMNIYNLCKDEYELLGYNDIHLKMDRPFCYDGLNQFFCNYKIIDLDKRNIDDLYAHITNNACADENLIQQILSTIKGCIQENLNNKETNSFSCPSLDMTNYKITNITQFCLEAEKRESFVDKDQQLSIQYTKIREEDIKKCHIITEMFNSCIDSDNLLYPYSNYKKCFYSNNAMYLCNKVERYSQEDYEIVY
jgi:hypothetical protein